MILNRVVCVALSLTFVLTLAACGRTPQPPASAPADGAPVSGVPNADGYTDITVPQLAQMLQAKDFTFVNVHVPYEGEIPQTDLNIPYDRITDHLAELPAKDAPIVLYCRSGRMSAEAAEVLAKRGYTNVSELDGGFNAWKDAGHELLNEP